MDTYLSTVEGTLSRARSPDPRITFGEGGLNFLFTVSVRTVARSYAHTREIKISMFCAVTRRSWLMTRGPLGQVATSLRTTAGVR